MKKTFDEISENITNEYSILQDVMDYREILEFFDNFMLEIKIELTNKKIDEKEAILLTAMVTKAYSSLLKMIEG